MKSLEEGTMTVWKRSTLIGVGALAVLAISTGCSSPNESEHPAGHSPSSSVAAAPSTTAPAEAHNDADVTFAQHMIPHHTQAIEMSDTLLAKQGIDARVTLLANQIKAAQGPEIQQMQGWLTQWGTPPVPTMSGHGDMAGGSGMMSEQDMTALKDAKGVDAAKLFLTQMIAYHQGAITMAQNEIKDGQYPPAVAMAHAIATSQQQEIDTMKAILATL
jgi:uncharacterized protein (DUF305 family)